MAGTRLVPCTLAALALGLVAAPVAHANSFDDIFHEYQRTGKIDPCHFTQQQLEGALGQVPNDIETYAPDFPDALQAAAEQRAGGACKKRPGPAAAAPASTPGTPAAPSPGAAAPGAPGASAATPAPAPDLEPAKAATDRAISRTAASARGSDAGPPAPVVALAVLAALLGLGGLGYGLARWLAWDPAWARGARHAMGEAGWRASASWAEFADWLRLGR
jgi:hypothetical protein